MGHEKRDIEQPHLVEAVLLGHEGRFNDVFQAVVSHQVTDQRCDDGPENVGLNVFLEEPAESTAGEVLFFRERQRPRVNVGILFDDVWVCVVLDVVFFAPVIHRQTGEQREGYRGQRQVTCFGLASRRVDAFVANHGDGGGEQARQREKHEPPLEREIDVSSVQTTHHAQENQNLRPGLGGGLVKQPLFLQFFSKIGHRMCSHLHHQRSGR